MKLTASVATLILTGILTACGGETTGTPDALPPQPAPEPEPVAAVVGPTTPMPEFAAEIIPLVGQVFSVAFPVTTQECIGHLDGVVERFGADRAGIRAAGWAFNIGDKAPYQLFVAADAAGVIQGGAVGKTPRPDVIAARPDEITSEDTGYDVLAAISSGTITIYGINADTNEACIVGSLSDVTL